MFFPFKSLETFIFQFFFQSLFALVKKKKQYEDMSFKICLTQKIKFWEMAENLLTAFIGCHCKPTFYNVRNTR